MTKSESAIAELKTLVGILNTRIDRADQDMQRLGMAEIRERSARIET